ncbi:ABC transporter ATP-binding protein [Thermoclostridium stercorarium subsp. stercorarium DSM 8532]|jgi:ABC-2 type transport system ATP-binding protein|uniref:ABC transporter ATP-binding protein n=2 Tax=Thermoclostridium stercorarium TaxID=1510 RepID=L7VP21_THES1|nr:ABC transporter ATP-binding protein [Thermoclostridium stercorarium]AGC68527.1 ABC transporter ATP-binding protein [Thermoclostridium stercorarium subsp. stercorarium DSM 8532]
MMVVVENLTKKFNSTVAVDRLCMEIPRGEIYGFVGANGAGKTTTMRIIAGLLAPTSGRVLIDGIDTAKEPLKVKERIGYMPDFFGVYDDLKVTEYMAFYAGLQGIYGAKCRELTDSLLELVRLSDKKEAYVDTLSRGMKQRLCLARSLIHNPEFLILDEPASGLDPRARVEMKEILKELRSMGKTVLISSHILPELAELCTSIGIIDSGRLVASGSVKEITEKLSQAGVIKIRVADREEEAVKILMEMPEVKEISSFADELEIKVNCEKDAYAGILKKLVMNEIPVISFHPQESSLESVFMKLTERGNGDEN